MLIICKLFWLNSQMFRSISKILRQDPSHIRSTTKESVYPRVSQKIPASFTLFTRRTSSTMSEGETKQTISYVTISDEGKARKLARSLVENRLAACVNIVREVKSIYEWQGKIEEDSESLLIIKSDSSKTDDLTQFVESNHPYDCPEVVTVKIDSGSKKYLDWVSETVRKPPLSQ